MRYIVALLALLACNASAFDIYNGAGANGKDRFSPSSVSVDAAGYALTNIPSYSYQMADFAPVATATDYLCLTGSATKTIRVNRIQISADATAASVIDLYVYKRSVLNTGGTSTTPSPVMMDTSNSSATATLRLYTANPSALGTGALLLGDHFSIPAATGANNFSAPFWVEDFGNRNNQALTIRGVNESVCASLNGQTLPAGLSIYLHIGWTEE